jgi:hypothetical protein
LGVVYAFRPVNAICSPACPLPGEQAKAQKEGGSSHAVDSRESFARLWHKMNVTQVHFPLNNRKSRAAKVMGIEDCRHVTKRMSGANGNVTLEAAISHSRLIEKRD